MFRMTGVVVSLLTGIGLGERIAQGAHPCDQPKDAPTGDIIFESGFVTIGSTEYMGVGGQGDVRGWASDKDDHCADCCNCAAAFDNINTVSWSGDGDFDPVDDWEAVWTAPDTPGTATLKLNVKDDGFHYQDLQGASQVASENVR